MLFNLNVRSNVFDFYSICIKFSARNHPVAHSLLSGLFIYYIVLNLSRPKPPNMSEIQKSKFRVYTYTVEYSKKKCFPNSSLIIY